MKFELQEHLGKYPIVRELGSGATSRVYLARDPFAERDVAIKVFLFEEQADPQTERMKHKAFLAEASLAGKLNHPHIVAIYDAVVEPDHSYLVMEYVPGVTLEAHAEVATLLPLAKVVEIIFKCIRALEYAYQHGVIHRDIKPGNILLSSGGESKVGDFGAALMHKHPSQTTQITAIGSPAYMSPEQIRLETVNHQTDIYSLGVTMYRLLTGRLPFQASTQAALTYAILSTLPASPAKLRPEIPPLVDGIVMKAMAKDPKARYASWLEFGKDLSQAFTTLRLAGASVTDSEKFNRLRQMEFFAQFGDVALWEAVRIGAWRTIAPGTVIIREGEGGDSFYVLVEGELDVTLRGMHLATIRPGGCFGEISCFTERVRQRTTTLTAPREVTAIEIKADGLRASTYACQAAFTKAVMRVVIDRLLEQNERLTVSVAEARVPALKKAQ